MKKGYFCKFTRLYSEDQEKGGFMVRDWTKDYFHEKYECYCDMVYRICMLYLKNESDARDGLQDIFLKNVGKTTGL